MKIWVSRVLWLAALALFAAIVTGFAGKLHPAGDSLSAFRPQLTIALWGVELLAMCVMAKRIIMLAGLGLAIAVLGSMLVIMPGYRLFPEEHMRLYSQNLRFSNAETDKVLEAIRDFAPDVVALQEVSEVTRPVFDALAAEYPVAEFCRFGGVGGVALLSKHPLAGEVACAEGQGLLLVSVETNYGPVTFGSIHLPWPWPHGQARQAEKLAEIVAARDDRMVIAGDFNMAPWGASVQGIGQASKTTVVPWLRFSFQREWIPLGLPLDHVLVPEGIWGQSEKLAYSGSDHAAIGTMLHFRE